MQKRVLIVNPDPAERDRICRLLGADPNWRVEGLAGCAALLDDTRSRAGPDLVLIEPAAFREEDAAGQVAAARSRWSRARVVVFAEPGNGGSPGLDGVEVLPRPSSLLRLRSLVASSGARASTSAPAAARLHGFEGYLEGIPLADLIQILCVTRRTGRLRLQAAEGGGEISFIGGEVGHARDGSGEGEAAFYRMMELPAGRFGFDDGIESRTTTIRAGWEHLLMEAMRRRDEAGSDTSPGPPDHGCAEELAAAEPDLSGRQVGAYQLVRLVRRYPDGALYEALHPSIRERPRMFILNAGLARDPMRVGRVLRRAQVLLGIRHPNLVRTIAGGESEGIPHCLEEHVEGVTLQGRMRELRYLDSGQAMAVFRECLRGLGRLHAEGLGHGRIEGDSIILGYDGIPRLGRLNGFLQHEPTLNEDVASLAAALRAALRPADCPGEAEDLLSSLAAGKRPWETLDDLLAPDSRAPGPAERPRRRWRIPWKGRGRRSAGPAEARPGRDGASGKAVA